MPGEVLTVVKTPIAELAEELKLRHGISETLTDTHIEGDMLVMYFSRNPSNVPEEVKNIVKSTTSEVSTTVATLRRRSSRGKRNRMRTRGWQAVDRFVNSKGQTTVIYKPLVDALKEGGQSPTQQRALVAQILRANGNRPGPGSIDYFMSNTLEYLHQQASKKEA